MGLELNGFHYDNYCGVWFALCTNCNGSRKVFDEEEDNENGLIQCLDCGS